MWDPNRHTALDRPMRRWKSRLKLRTGLLRGRERDLDWPKRNSVRARKTDVVNIV